jgi:hypothetical protein
VLTIIEHISNEKLTPRVVPAPDSDFAEIIYPFAMTFDGYEVWGDADVLREAAFRMWEVEDRTGVLPESLTKLRTSLFALGRMMRFTDFDEDVFGVEGSEADLKQRVRKHIAAIAEQIDHGPRGHLTMIQATAAAVARLTDIGQVKEREVRIAIAESLAELLDEPVASSATGREITFPELPLWVTSSPPGPFDVIVGDRHTPRIAAEVKWAATNTLSHSLWDILKLLGVLALGAEQVYMAAGYPTRVWDKARFAQLYETGVVGYSELPLAKEWPSLLRDSTGTPLRLPNAVQITEVARMTIAHAGERWQLRTVAIDPAAGGWLELKDGGLAGACQVGRDDPT